MLAGNVNSTGREQAGSTQPGSFSEQRTFLASKIFALFDFIFPVCSDKRPLPLAPRGRDTSCPAGAALAQEPSLKETPRATRVPRCSSRHVPQGHCPAENCHFGCFQVRIPSPWNFAQRLTAPNTQSNTPYPEYPTPALGGRHSLTCLPISALSSLNQLEICTSTI